MVQRDGRKPRPDHTNGAPCVIIPINIFVCFLSHLISIKFIAFIYYRVTFQKFYHSIASFPHFRIKHPVLTFMTNSNFRHCIINYVTNVLLFLTILQIVTRVIVIIADIQVVTGVCHYCRYSIVTRVIVVEDYSIVISVCHYCRYSSYYRYLSLLQLFKEFETYSFARMGEVD